MRYVVTLVTSNVRKKITLLKYPVAVNAQDLKAAFSPDADFSLVVSLDILFRIMKNFIKSVEKFRRNNWAKVVLRQGH